MNLSEALREYLPAIENVLRDMLVPTSAEFKSFYGMLQYHHGWLDESLRPLKADSGKRVRPVLCLLSCEACGGEYQRALPLAAAIELLHSFSLVHDDIEDRSPMRRHRPTIWSLWGEAQAINAGDGIHALSHVALYRLIETLPSDLVVKIAAEFDQTCLRLCEGQYLDMSFEADGEVSMAEYMLMIEGKTATLMRFAAWSGAMAASHLIQAEFMGEMGRELGMAFQIQDDILGVWGDEEETGKSASSDIVSAKKTMPFIYARDNLPFEKARTLLALYAKAKRNEGDVAQARALLDEAGAREYCLALAESHTNAALARLETVGLFPEPVEALRELVVQLSGRRR